MRPAKLLTALTLLTATATQAQWQIQDAHTAADLRGIDSVGNGVAWASGSNGTVLRTEDAGFVWQLCAVPPGAEKLDFRGIQAFDNNTAIVMSSGKGDLSRLYKTTDGCQTWKLIFSNPYAPDGFFDALIFVDKDHGILFGDPSPLHMSAPDELAGSFRIRLTGDGGTTWAPVGQSARDRLGEGLYAMPGESAFAASNSAITSRDGWVWFATSSGRVSRKRLYARAVELPYAFISMACLGRIDPASGVCGIGWPDTQDTATPVHGDTPSSGIFSLGFSNPLIGQAVGGDYLKPGQRSATAAYSSDGGLHWTAATRMPGGYRSAVAYDPKSNTWITVGPNGTDISTDDGRNWRPLKPNPAVGDQPDADQHWNALSLPFVVGPHGRVGVLRPEALSGAKK